MNTLENTPPDTDRRRALNGVTGYLVVAEDGPVGPVELPLLPPDGDGAEYVVVRTGGWLRHRHPVVSCQLVSRVDRARGRVYVDATSEQISRLPEQIPLAT